MIDNCMCRFKNRYNFDFLCSIRPTDYYFGHAIRIKKNNVTKEFIISDELLLESYSPEYIIYDTLQEFLNFYGVYMSGQVIYSKLNYMIHKCRLKYGQQDCVIYIDKTSWDELQTFVTTNVSGGVIDGVIYKDQYYGCDVFLVDGPVTHLNVATKYTYEG